MTPGDKIYWTLFLVLVTTACVFLVSLIFFILVHGGLTVYGGVP